jgi:aminopeptidase YwaD
MKAVRALLWLLAVPAAAAAADAPPLLQADHSAAIAQELSGGAAKGTVEALSRHHRMRGSEPYAAAAEHIRGRLADYGLADVDVIALPADGRIFYGTQLARPAWNARFAELWEQKLTNGRWTDSDRIASWADQPITLAQDSVRHQ